ncbi:MAG: 3-phosphoshikimate 1-carboxyvinyltransferase, partial [Lachnospiraceae bacterium]|nr:3-phosphoshikimate 1-carboxyvinyltransferase [Lachnospiraceae bacterium]
MKLYPSRLRGEITIQPSKSYLHRMIIMSALSGKRVEINNVNYSQDVLATLLALKAMGLCDYEKKESSVIIKKGRKNPSKVIDCNESGSTLRFLIALGLAMDKELTFIGRGRLMERPLNVYESLCKEKGWDFALNDKVLKIKGSLKAGDYIIRGDVSSQFISGLMMALSKIQGNSTITVTGKMESVGYIDITLEVLRLFGVKAGRNDNIISITGGIAPPKTVTVQGDWSHGANYACIGGKNGGLVLKGLESSSAQRDSSIIDILR